MEKKKTGKKIVNEMSFLTQLLFAILFISIYILSSFLFGLTNTRISSDLSFDADTSTFNLNNNHISSDDSIFIGNNWIVVPNFKLTDMRSGSNYDFNCYKDWPYADNVSITRFGWDDLGNCEWHNLPDGKDQTSLFVENDNYQTTNAYFARFKLPANINSFDFNIPSINGTAYVFCNGIYIGSLGTKNGNGIGSLSCGYQSLAVQKNSAGYIELTIIIKTNYATKSGGITSIPALESAKMNTTSMILPSVWLALIIVTIGVSVLGGRILSNTFRDKRKYYFFVCYVFCFLAFTIFDAEFFVTDTLRRNCATYLFLMFSAISAYCFISSLFVNSETNRHLNFWKYDSYVITFTGLALITLSALDMKLMSTEYPHITAIGFTIIISFISVLKVLFLYINDKNATIGICAAITSLFCFDAMINKGMYIYNVPLYSIDFTIALVSLAVVFTYGYVRQYKELTSSSLHLQYMVEEKTQHISEINRDLYNTNKKLLENEEARKSIMSNVSHDLRTPITAIRGYAELLISTKDNMSKDQVDTYLHNIIKRAQQMERIVSDIVEISRMESSKTEFEFMDVSISELLDEMFMLYDSELRQTKKKINISLPDDDMLIVKADPKKISRVFENLISNAINYTKEEAEISINAWRTGKELSFQDQRIHVTISDNGIGIPSAEIPMIFDRFYRAKNSGQNIKGTGLGLSIVKMIVDRHDAEIIVESELGKGTTFHIILKPTY